MFPIIRTEYYHTASPIEVGSLMLPFVRNYQADRFEGMTKFQTVLKQARFVYSPYAATEMQGFAQVLGNAISARIQSGQNT